MAQREPHPPTRSAHVTVFTAEGVPVKYPKAQLHRIAESARLFTTDPSGAIPGGEIEPEVSFPVVTGGGWYELSDGSRVKGKDSAEDQQKELDG